MMMVSREQRWGFLAPWCSEVKGSIGQTDLDNEEELWRPLYSLHVSFPRRSAFDTDAEFQATFQKRREAVALLSAVAHVDYSAWKFLLTEYCGVTLQRHGDTGSYNDVKADFLLSLDAEQQDQDVNTHDLVEICGVRQREHPSREYLAALAQIAALDKRLKPNRDIEIPVRVHFWSEIEAVSPSDAVKELLGVRNAEHLIRQEWSEYESRQEHGDVKPGSLRCTFVLEPMVADLSELSIGEEFKNTLDDLMLGHVWFSLIQSFCLELESRLVADEDEAKKMLGQMLTRLFCTTRQELTSTSYRSSRLQEATALQIGTLKLYSNVMPQCNFEALCSAIVVNQTVQNLSLEFNMRRSNYQLLWGWLAYAVFSERAHNNSLLESLELKSVDRMSAADIHRFCAILASKHPEEELFDCPRGRINERDAKLASATPICWKLDDQMQPVENGFLTSSVSRVRTLSDDGVSEWVSVLVPGYGHCRVRRVDLLFEDNEKRSQRCAFNSLTLKFNRDEEPDSTGLPRFLEVVGPSLISLTLDIATVDDLDENSILRSCPNVEELSLCHYYMDVHLNVREYRVTKQPIPELNCHWTDMEVLIRELSDSNSPTSKCMRRLRLHLHEVTRVYLIAHGSHVDFSPTLDELLAMLEVNQGLEFLGIDILPVDASYLTAFQKFHHQPIGRMDISLSLECKLAFLSVPDAARRPSKDGKPRFKRAFHQLDPHAASIIFAFAASPVLRQVLYGAH